MSYLWDKNEKKENSRYEINNIIVTKYYPSVYHDTVLKPKFVKQMKQNQKSLKVK